MDVISIFDYQFAAIVLGADMTATGQGYFVRTEKLLRTRPGEGIPSIYVKY